MRKLPTSDSNQPEKISCDKGGKLARSASIIPYPVFARRTTNSGRMMHSVTRFDRCYLIGLEMMDRISWDAGGILKNL